MVHWQPIMCTTALLSLYPQDLVFMLQVHLKNTKWTVVSYEVRKRESAARSTKRSPGTKERCLAENKRPGNTALDGFPAMQKLVRLSVSRAEFAEIGAECDEIVHPAFCHERVAVTLCNPNLRLQFCRMQCWRLLPANYRTLLRQLGIHMQDVRRQASLGHNIRLYFVEP